MIYSSRKIKDEMNIQLKLHSFNNHFPLLSTPQPSLLHVPDCFSRFSKYEDILELERSSNSTSLGIKIISHGSEMFKDVLDHIREGVNSIYV